MTPTRPLMAQQVHDRSHVPAKPTAPESWRTARRDARSVRDLTSKQQAKIRRRPVAGFGLWKQVIR